MQNNNKVSEKEDVLSVFYVGKQSWPYNNKNNDAAIFVINSLKISNSHWWHHHSQSQCAMS